MTVTLDHQPALPSRIGQGTAVEQSRAIAEVQAAVVVAQQIPRSIARAETDMRRSCAQKSLAEKAFYRFPRGKETVSGPSVQLARELARCFGNVQYGLTELRRDDGYGQSEMQAWAWDLETNTRSSTTFIVPHRRDKRGGPETLTDMRDIYENNANNGSRRLREMIFAILPGWYTEDAVAACYETLAGDDSELPGRIKQCIEGFGKLGVRQVQLEQKTGGPAEKWTPHDLAQMQVIYRSLVRGETSKDEEFGTGPGRVTAADITARPSAPQNASPAVRQAAPAPAPADQSGPPPGPAGEAPGHAPRATSGQVSIIRNHFTRLGFDLEDPTVTMLDSVAQLAGLDDITSPGELDQDQAARVIKWLVKCNEAADLEQLLETGEVPGE